jgi:CDP-diacylglycerol pyrophosphatase
MLEDGKVQTPNQNQDLKSALRGDELVENIKERWKAKLPYTAIGHQILISTNLNDRFLKKKEKEKQLKKAVKKNGIDANLIMVETEDENFLLLLDEERQMLIHDPRSNHIVQEHNQAHIFTFAARCYWHLLRERENQVIVAV